MDTQPKKFRDSRIYCIRPERMNYYSGILPFSWPIDMFFRISQFTPLDPISSCLLPFTPNNLQKFLLGQVERWAPGELSGRAPLLRNFRPPLLMFSFHRVHCPNIGCCCCRCCAAGDADTAIRRRTVREESEWSLLDPGYLTFCS